MTKRFQRSVRGRNTKDAKGLIRVTVLLPSRRGSHTPGNIIRTCRVQDARVSEVFAAIEAALFEDEDSEEDCSAAAARMGARGGRAGGIARAEKLSPTRRSEIARMGANARWGRDEGEGE